MPATTQHLIAGSSFAPSSKRRDDSRYLEGLVKGKVIRVVDADTLLVRYKDHSGIDSVRYVRAANTNAPEVRSVEDNRPLSQLSRIERNQYYYGDLAANRLREILRSYNNEILLKLDKSKDVYDRQLASYYTPSGQSIEKILAEEGLTLYKTNDKRLSGTNPTLELEILRAQRKAQRERRGIFSEGLYLPPDEFLAQIRKRKVTGADITLGSLIDNVIGLIRPKHRFESYIRATNKLEERLRLLSVLEEDAYISRLDQLRQRYGDEAAKLVDPITYYKAQAFRRNTDYETYVYAKTRRNIFGEDRVILRTPVYGDITSQVFESIYQAKRVALGYELLNTEELPKFIVELDKRRAALSPVERVNREVFNNLDSTISPYVALGIGLSTGVVAGMFANVTLEALAYNLSNYGTLTERAFAKQAQTIGRTLANNRGRLAGATIVGLLTGALLTAYLSNRNTQEVLNLGYPQKYNHKRLLFENPSDSLTKDLYMAVVNRLDVLINGLNVGSRGTIRTAFGNIREQPKRDSTILKTTLEGLFNVTQDLILGTAIYYRLMIPAQQAVQSLLSGVFHYTLASFGGVERIRSTPIGSSLLALHQEVVATFRRAQAQNAFLGLFGRLGAAVGLDINITTPAQGGVVSKNLIKFDNFSSFEEFVSKIDSQLINPAEHMKVYGADPAAYLMPDAAGILKTIGFRFGGPGRQVSFTVNKDRLWEGFIGRTKEEKLASAQRFADALNDLFSIIGYENYGNLQLSSGLTYTADQLLGAARDQLKQAQIQKAMSQVYANPLRWFGIVPAGAESTEVSMAAVFGSTGFIARTVGYAVGRPPVLRLSPASSTIKTTLDEIKYLIDRFRGVATPEQLQAIKTSRNILTTRAMLMHRGASTQDLEQINEIINTVVRDPRHPTDQISSLLIQTRYRTSLGTKLARAGASALIYGLLFTYMFKTSTGLDATTQFGDAIAQLGLEFPVPNDTPLINIGWSSVSIRVRDTKTGEIREEERIPWFNRFVYSAFVGYAVYSYFAFEGQASILKAGAAQVLAAMPGARQIPAISTFIRDSFDEYFQQAGLKTALNRALRASDFTDLTALLKHGPNFTQKLTASKVLAGRGFRALLGAASTLTAISLVAGLFNSISYSLKVASLGGMYQEGTYVDPTLQARLKYLWDVYQERYFESPNKLRTRGLAPIYTYDVMQMLDIDSAQQGESQGVRRQAGTQQIGSIYATTLFGYDITRNRMRFTTGMQLPLYTMGVGFDLPVQIILKEPTETQLRDQQRDVSIFRYPILPYIGDNNILTPIPIPFTGGRTGRFVYVASSTLAEFYKSYAALRVAYSRIIIPTKLLKAAGNKVISVFDSIASRILERNQSAFFNTVADSVTVVGEIIGGTLYSIGENVTDNIFVKILKFTHDLAKFTLDVSTATLKAYLSQGSRLVGQFRYSLVQGSKQALERFLNRAVQNSAAQASSAVQSPTLTLTRSQVGNIVKGIGNIAVSTYLGELVGQQVFGVEGVGGTVGLAVSLLQTIHSIEVTRQVNKFIKTDPRFAVQAGTANLDDITIANLRAAVETKEQTLRAGTKIGGFIPRPTARNLGTLATLVVGAAVLYGAFENSNRRIPKKLRLPEGLYRFSIDLTVIPGYQALTTRKVIFRYADGTEVERRIPKLFNLPTGGIYLPQKIDIGQLLKQLTGVSDHALDFYSVKAKLRAYNTYGDRVADLIDPSVLGPRVDYTKDRNLISIFTRPFKILFDRTYFGNTLTDASGGGGIHLGLGGATARQYDGNVYVGSSYMQFQGAVSDISFAENIMRSAFTPGILQSVLGDSALMLLNDQITFVGVSDEDKDALIAGLFFAGLPTKPLPKPRQISPIVHRSVYRILSGNRATTAALAKRSDYLAWLANANQLDLAMMYNRTPYRKDVDEEGRSAGFLPGFPDGFSFFLAGALRFPNYFTRPIDREYGRSLESTFYEGIEITGRERSLLLVGQDVALGPAKTIGLIAGTTIGALIGIGVAARVLDRVYQASGRAITRNLGIINSTYANLNALIPETVEHLASAARMAQAVKIEGLVSDSGAFNVTIGGARQLSYTIPVSTDQRYSLIYSLTESIEKGQNLIGTILSERQRILTSFWGYTPEEGFGGLIKSVKGAPNVRQIDALIKQLNELKKNLSTSPFGLISNEQLEVVNAAIENIARLNSADIDTVQNLLTKSFGIDPRLTAELTSSVDDVLSAAQKYRNALDPQAAGTIQTASKELAQSMNTLASKLRKYTQTVLDQLPIQSVGHFGAGMSLADRVVEIGTAGLAKRTEDVIGAVPISTRPPSMTGEASLLNAARNKLAAARQSFNKLTTSPSVRVRATVATKTTTKVFGRALSATPYALTALKATDLFSSNVAPTTAARGTIESIEAVGQYTVTAFLINQLLTLTTTGLAAVSAHFAMMLGGSMLLGGLAATAIGIAILGTVGFIAAETGIDKNKNFSLFHALGKAFNEANRRKGGLGTKGRVFLGSLWESLGDTAEVVFRRAGQGLDYLAGLEIPFTGGYSYKTFRRDSIRTLANLSIGVREAADEGNPLASALIDFMTPLSNTREAVAVAAYRRYRDINRRMAEGNASLLESIEAITFGIITNNLLTPSNPLILMDMKETRDKYRYFSPFVPAGGDVLNNRLESLLADLADQLDYALGNTDMPLISALTYGVPNQRPNSIEGLRNSTLLSSSAGAQRVASRFRPISMITRATALQLEIRSQLAAQVFADSYYRALYINRNLDSKRFFKEEKIPDAIFPEGPNYRMRYKPPRSRRHTVRGIVPPFPSGRDEGRDGGRDGEGPTTSPGKPPLTGPSVRFQDTDISAIDSGLVTGPAGVIGSGSAYHIDIKFSKRLPIEKKVALFDALALGYRAQGRVIEFSNSAVSGLVYNPDAPFEEKARLLQRAEAAHSHSVHRDFTSIDYYTPKQGSNRFEDTSLRGAPILVPVLPGLRLKYGSGGGYGNYVVAIDPEGNVLYKTGHGDSRYPLPRDRVIPNRQPDKQPGGRTPFDLAFLNKAKQVASNLGMDPDHLLAIISFETGGTFRSDVQNPRSLATGLIQFLPSTAAALGYTIGELKVMTPHEQLDVVEKYLRPYKGKLNTLESAYMAVLYPAAVGAEPDTVLFRRGTRAYSQNIGLDVNRDNVITVGEAASKVRAHLELVRKYQADLIKSEEAKHIADATDSERTRVSSANILGFSKPTVQARAERSTDRESLKVLEQASISTKFTKDRLDFINRIASGSVTLEEFLSKPPLTADELRLLDKRLEEDERNFFQKLLGFSTVLGTIIGGSVLGYRLTKVGIGKLEDVAKNLRERVNQLNETKRQKRVLRESLLNEQLSDISVEPRIKVSELARQRLQTQRKQVKRRLAQARVRYRFDGINDEVFKPAQPALDLYPTELGPSSYGVSSGPSASISGQVQSRDTGTAIVPVREIKIRDALIEDTRPNFRRLPEGHRRPRDVGSPQPNTPTQLPSQDLNAPDNTLYSQVGVSYRGRDRGVVSKLVGSPKAADVRTKLINKSKQVLRSTEITVTKDKLHLTLKEGDRIIAELKTSELVAHDLTHLITGYDFTREGELKAVEWEMKQFNKEVSDFEVDIYDSLYKVPDKVKILLLGGYKKLGEGSKVTINFYGDRFDIDFNYIATDDRSSSSTLYDIGNNRYIKQNPTSPLQRAWNTWIELLGNRSDIRDITGYSGLSRTYTKVAARNRIVYDLVTKLPQVGLQPSEIATKKNQLLQLADQLGIKVYLNEDFTKQGLKPDIQGFYRKGEVHIASGLNPELEVRVLAHELRHAAQDIQGKLTGNLDKPTKPGGASRRTIFERQAEGAQGNVDIVIRRLEKLTKKFPARIKRDDQQRNRIVSLTGSAPPDYIEFTPQALYKTKFFTPDKKPGFTVLGFVRELSRAIDPTVDVELLGSVSPAPYSEFGMYQLGEYYREEGATSGSIRLRQDLYDRLNVGLATLEDLEIVAHELGHFHFDVKGRSVEIANSTLEDVERAINRSPFRDRILGSVAELKGEVRVYINQLDLSDPRHQKLAEDALNLLKVKMYEEFVVYPFGEVYTELAKSIYDRFDFFGIDEATPTLYSRRSVSTLSGRTVERDVSDSIVRLSKSIDEQTASIRRKNLGRFNGTNPRDLLESGLVESSKELSSSDLPKNADASRSIKIQDKVNNRQLPLTQSNQKNRFGEYKHKNKYPVKGSLDFVDPAADPPPALDLSTLSTRSELTGGNQYGLQVNPMVSQPVGITGQRYTFSNNSTLPSVATIPNAVVDNARAFRTGSGFVSSAGNAYDIAGTIAGAAQQTFNLNTEQTFGVGVATGALYLAGSSGVLGEKAGAGIVAAVEGRAVMGSTVVDNVITRNLQLGGAAVPIASQGAAITGALYAGDYSRATQRELLTSSSAAVASLITGKLYSLAAVSLLGGPKGWAASAVLLLTGLAVQMSAGSLVGQQVSKVYLQAALNDTLKKTPRYYDQSARVLPAERKRHTPRQDRIGTVGPARLLINAEKKLEEDIREIYNSVRGSVEVLIRANLEADLIAVEAAIQNLAGTTDRSKIRKRQKLTKWRNSLVNSIEKNLDKLTDEYINRQVELLKQQIALDDKPTHAVKNALIDAVVTAHRINELARDITNLNNQAEEERLRLIRGIVSSDDQEIIKEDRYPGLSDYLVQQAYKQEVQQRNKVTKQEKELQEQSSQSGQNTNTQKRVDVIQPDLGQPRDVRLERGKGTVDPAKKYIEPKIISATKAAIVQVSPLAAVINASAGLISNLRKINPIERVQMFFKFNREKEQVMNSDPAVQSSNPNGHIDPAKN